MPLSTIFFDLDDTLYPASCGVWKLIKERMNLYIHKQLGIPWDAIPALRDELFQKYGTTLRGLQANYPVNSDDYLAFVHDIPLQDYLQPDPDLIQVISHLPYRKLIFTNADATHAKRVLAALGLESCFDAIVDIMAVDPYCKPMNEAFEIALKWAAESDPANCLLVDDLPVNTRAARTFGMHAILFGHAGEHTDADLTLTCLKELPASLHALKY
jgi:putative hydrolase of the HAD superfamily